MGLGSKGSQGAPPHMFPLTGDIRRSWWNPAVVPHLFIYPYCGSAETAYVW
jgi:hypothetical protein